MSVAPVLLKNPDLFGEASRVFSDLLLLRRSFIEARAGMERFPVRIGAGGSVGLGTSLLFTSMLCLDDLGEGDRELSHDRR